MNIKNSSFLKYALIICFMSIVSGCSVDEKQKVVNYTNLVMQDEFSTDGPLNSAFWGYNIGTGSNGWGNNELEYYTDRPENVKIENGMLKITAIKESYKGAAYTSARILTKGKFAQKYGRFEARIKMPYGKGLWPAFWLLGENSDTEIWPKCGEIDIMEFRGNEPSTTNAAVHGPGYAGAFAITKQYSLLNDRFDTDFHVFGIEWGENYINFYVDDVLFNQITPKNVTGDWVFDQPFYIIINLAVGGNYGGSPNSETIFPQSMLIDYVRVYQ
jgi:beta-glucanase (GH16 family)